jgi:hypothetical protein
MMKHNGPFWTQLISTAWSVFGQYSDMMITPWRNTPQGALFELIHYLYPLPLVLGGAWLWGQPVKLKIPWRDSPLWLSARDLSGRCQTRRLFLARQRSSPPKYSTNSRQKCQGSVLPGLVSCLSPSTQLDKRQKDDNVLRNHWSCQKTGTNDGQIS